MARREDTKWEHRERKHKKRRYGMRVNGASIKAVLLRLIGRKAKEAQHKHREETGPAITGRPRKTERQSRK